MMEGVQGNSQATRYLAGLPRKRATLVGEGYQCHSWLSFAGANPCLALHGHFVHDSIVPGPGRLMLSSVRSSDLPDGLIAFSAIEVFLGRVHLDTDYVLLFTPDASVTKYMGFFFFIPMTNL